MNWVWFAFFSSVLYMLVAVIFSLTLCFLIHPFVFLLIGIDSDFPFFLFSSPFLIDESFYILFFILLRFFFKKRKAQIFFLMKNIQIRHILSVLFFPGILFCSPIKGNLALNSVIENLILFFLFLFYLTSATCFPE